MLGSNFNMSNKLPILKKLGVSTFPHTDITNLSVAFFFLVKELCHLSTGFQ